MPAYTYDAINASGRQVHGVIDAETERAARHQLRQQALVPLSLKPVLDEQKGFKRDIVLW